MFGAVHFKSSLVIMFLPSPGLLRLLLNNLSGNIVNY